LVIVISLGTTCNDELSLPFISQENVQSLAFSPDGVVIVAGYVSGKWQAMDGATREIVCTHHDGSEPIQTLKFSPDGRQLAVGSRDNTIYVYQVSEDGCKYSRVGRCVVSNPFLIAK